MCISMISFPIFAQQNDAISNLWDLLIRFCNDPEIAKEWWSKDLKMTATPWTGEDICIYLVNGGPTEVEVELGFVDGTVTNDAEQKKACQPESTISQFGQYVRHDQKKFTLQPKSTVETHAFVTFPQDTAGMVYGCATLKIVWWESNEGAIQVVSRRANFIDVSVTWVLRSSLKIVNQPAPVGWVVHNQDPRFYIISNPTTKEFFWKIVVKNDGNVAQYVSLQPTTSRWWKTISHETISKKVLPNQENEFLIPLTNMPWWKWALSVQADISSTPVLEEWATWLDATKLDTTPQTEQLIAKAFFMPWTLAFIILWVLFVGLILSGMRTKKKHH